MRLRRFVQYSTEIGQWQLQPFFLRISDAERVSRVWARSSRLFEKEIGSAYARDQTPQAVLCLARFEYILLICFHFIPTRGSGAVLGHLGLRPTLLYAAHITRRKTLSCQKTRQALTPEPSLREDRVTTGEYPICGMNPATHLSML
jgi:hypothetical protein